MKKYITILFVSLMFSSMVLAQSSLPECDVNDKNIASTKRHKELEKDFKKQMNESMPTLKELLFGE